MAEREIVWAYLYPDHGEFGRENPVAMESAATDVGMDIEFIPPLGEDATEEHAQRAAQIWGDEADRLLDGGSNAMAIDPGRWRANARKSILQGGRMVLLTAAEPDGSLNRLDKWCGLYDLYRGVDS